MADAETAIGESDEHLLVTDQTIDAAQGEIARGRYDRVVKFIIQDWTQSRPLDVSVPQTQEEIVEVIRLVPLIPQERIAECIVEQTVDAAMPQIGEPSVNIAKVIPQERLHQRTAEQIADTTMPQISEETVEVVQGIPHERVSKRIIELTVDMLVAMQHQAAVQKTEKYRDEDDVDDVKMEAKNGLENCCKALRNTSTEDKLNGKLEARRETFKKQIEALLAQHVPVAEFEAQTVVKAHG